MGTIQKLSSQVIDYAERVSEMADTAQGKHHQRTGPTTRWLLLPASGAALYALMKSDAFSRPAKEVMDEAKARASELPDDLLSMVRQSTAAPPAGTEADQLVSFDAAEVDAQAEARKTRGTRRRSSARKTNGVRALTSPTGSLVRFDCRRTREVDPSVKNVKIERRGIRDYGLRREATKAVIANHAPRAWRPDTGSAERPGRTRPPSRSCRRRP